MSKSLFLVALFTLSIAATRAQQPAKAAQSTAKPKIVFVCEHGSAKSIIAAAEFQQLALKNGFNVEVVSRGTIPDAEIPSTIRQGLRSNGIDVGSAKPVKVSEKDLAEAVRIVTFGPDLSQWLPQGVKALDWSATPSPSADYKASREYIVKHLEVLLGDLQKADVSK